MEKFKEQLKFRQLMLLAKLLFACGVISISYRLMETTLPEPMNDIVSGFQIGLIAGLFGVLLFYLIRNHRAIRIPDRLKKLYISETDERNQFIRHNSGAAGMEFIVYCFAVGTAVSGNINAMVFFTLLGACFFVIGVRGVLKLYYKNKF